MEGLTPQEAAKNLINELNECFSEEAQSTLEKKIGSLKAQADKLKGELDAVKKTSQQSQKYDQNQVASIYLRIYVFIEKLREFFTKETYEYLLYFNNGTSSNQVIMKKAALDDILPYIKVVEDSSKKLKLGLSMNQQNLLNGNNMKNLSNLAAQNNVLINQLNDFYLKLTQTMVFYSSKTKRRAGQKVISKAKSQAKVLTKNPNNKKSINVLTKEVMSNWGYSRVMAGFAYEAATAAALRLGDSLSNLNTTQLMNRLVKIYIQTIGNTAFYRGGDLSLSTEEASRLLSEDIGPIELQLKNLSSGFASVANFATLENVFSVIYNLLYRKEWTPEQIANSLNVYIFKAEKNIDDQFIKSLDQITETTLDNAMATFVKNNPNIKIF